MLIVSGMYINPQRLEVADMIPYLLVGNQIVVREGNPKHIDGKATLCGLNVAAPVGTVFETSAKQASAELQGRRQGGDQPAVAARHCELCAGADAGAGRCDHRLHADCRCADATRRQAPTRPVARRSTRTPRSVSRVRKDNPGLKAALEKR